MPQTAAVALVHAECGARADRAAEDRDRNRQAAFESIHHARDATQVVFAVLGGWAVVIAGARSALS